MGGGYGEDEAEADTLMKLSLFVQQNKVAVVLVYRGSNLSRTGNVSSAQLDSRKRFPAQHLHTKQTNEQRITITRDIDEKLRVLFKCAYRI
jgi:hypothetical protein